MLSATRDVDILIRRPDLSLARATLEGVGFIYAHLLDLDTFIDGPEGKPSGGVHILFAGEKFTRTTNERCQTSTNQNAPSSSRW